LCALFVEFDPWIVPGINVFPLSESHPFYMNTLEGAS